MRRFFSFADAFSCCGKYEKMVLNGAENIIHLETCCMGYTFDL